jgi:heterodisulfide reductase subunit A
MITLLNKPGITYHVSTEIKEVERGEKGFKVKIQKKPVILGDEYTIGKDQPVEAILEGNEYKYVYPQFKTTNIDQALLKQVASSKCNDCTSMFPAGLIKLENDMMEEILEIGSVVLATGFKDYDPSNIPKYGYGLDDVITQFQVARLIDPFGPTGGVLLRPSDVKAPDSIVMIQCVGSRDKEYNSYCSKYCCMAAIKHATLIKKQKIPEADITVLYRDIRASGYGFEALYNEAKELGINFVHGDILSVSSNEKRLRIEYTDSMGNNQTLNSELVVLSNGMSPSDGADELAEMFNVEVTESGFMKEIDEKVANITTRVPGVFIAGACASPKNIPESIAQAGAAAFMSGAYMQYHVEKKVDHPIVNQDHCGKCGICRSVCPYEAISILKDDYPQFNPELCQSCGLCVSSCPTHALETPNYGFDLIDAQVDAIVGERESDPLIMSFACDDCGYNLLDTIGFEKVNYSTSFVPIYINCMSNLSLRHVLDSVNKGVDGIMLLGCVKDRCHFLKGTKRSKGQMKIIENFFMTTGIKTPIKILESSGSMVRQFTEALDELETKVMEVKR